MLFTLRLVRNRILMKMTAEVDSARSTGTVADTSGVVIASAQGDGQE